MGVKSVKKSNQYNSNDDLLVNELFDIDKQLAYFYRKHERYLDVFDLRHHRVTSKMQNKFDKINQKLDSMTKVYNFRSNDSEDQIFTNIFNLDFHLNVLTNKISVKY